MAKIIKIENKAIIIMVVSSPSSFSILFGIIFYNFSIITGIDTFLIEL